MAAPIQYCSYRTQDIIYPSAADGLGIVMTFRGPLYPWQEFTPDVFYTAEVMNEYQDKNLPAEEPIWKITGFLAYTLNKPFQTLQSEIIIAERLSEYHAVEMLYELQEENVRYNLYNSAVFKTELADEQLSGNIIEYPVGADPMDYNVGENFIERQTDTSTSFPYIVTTRQLLTNWSSFAELQEQAKQANQAEPDPLPEILRDDEEENDENGEVDFYRPLEEVDILDLAKNVSEESFKELKENLEQLMRPVQFVAIYKPDIVPVIIPGSDDKDPEGAAQYQGQWEINGIQDGWKCPLVTCADFKETLQILCNLQTHILEPSMESDPYHKHVQDNYSNHYTAWQEEADNINQLNRSGQFRF